MPVEAAMVFLGTTRRSDGVELQWYLADERFDTQGVCFWDPSTKTHTFVGEAFDVCIVGSNAAYIRARDQRRRPENLKPVAKSDWDEGLSYVGTEARRQ